MVVWAFWLLDGFSLLRDLSSFRPHTDTKRPMNSHENNA